MKSATVKGRFKDPDRNIIGTFNENLIVNLIFYNVELPDSVVKQYTYKTIAKNIYTQVYQHGHS